MGLRRTAGESPGHGSAPGKTLYDHRALRLRPTLTPSSNRIDYQIVGVLALAYAGLVLTLLPSTDLFRMLAGALMLAAVVVLAVSVVPEMPPNVYTVFAVSTVSMAVLVMPGFKAMGGHNGPSLPIGFFGAQVLALLWATMTWRESGQPRTRTELGDVLRLALKGAVVLSAIASLPIVLLLLTSTREAIPYLLVYPGYFVGALAAGLVYWILRAVNDRPAGRFLIGGLMGTCMLCAIAPVVQISEHQPIVIGDIMWLGAVCGFMVGPPVALSLKDSSAISR